VIHAVGPVWRGGDHGEPTQLSGAYRSALSIAAELGARTLTLPAISAGAYGYPLDDAARIAVATVADSLRAGAPLERVTFVLFSPGALAAFERALSALR
jgi:O-acetyl-ADP-ribose deacetylase (regulator of RNase III)